MYVQNDNKDFWVIKLINREVYYADIHHLNCWTTELNIAKKFHSKKSAMQELLSMLGDFEVAFIVRSK